MIRAEKITFAVRGRELVSSVDFTLKPGAVTAILGPNGAGKSTLLKLLCRQIKPTSGRVFYADKPLEDWNARALARQRAVLPQHSVVPFEFTALDIVLLGRSPHGDSARCEDMALAALQRTDCAHLASRTVNTLSGGELQRVHLARVLVQLTPCEKQPAHTLLLDEPTSSLDLAHQHTTLRIAREMAAAGVSVLVVLHDLNLAAQYADHVVVMTSGRLHTEGTPREVLTPSLVAEVFGVEARILENPFGSAPAVFVAPAR